ncbi:fumarylacetoacetate hydrolase family protein [Bacillus alkalicellulosilyticus]|uniref:fumarylacetoacetate hydrolase family protein n=1 Tax=Alkalihalobacterium alkalicellulosilyticum TaxID=1912214 RepID=UPI000996547F|nr:fumarylacetoacetate hydrolase family protein [Bacillus alkalicellulosilyticus]
MRFVSLQQNNCFSIGVVINEANEIVNLNEAQTIMKTENPLPNSLIDCLEREDFLKEVSNLLEWIEKNQLKQCTYQWDTVQVVAPIPRPRKNIFCVGKNYAAHAIEMGSAADIPSNPMIFSKTPTTVTGPNAFIDSHSELTKELDYEGEIAVIIGKTGKNIQKDEVEDYIFGYTLVNDVTARDLQRKHKQFLLGKSLDTSCPMGPWITHKSEIENPDELFLQTKVNGEIRQAASTNQFIFDIPTIIETISKGTTLEIGDIIATGTPAGVGSGFTPPKHLKPGDVIEISVKELGTLRNTVR